MAQMMKSGGASTSGDLCLKYFTIFTAPLSLHNCLESHIVFDQYIETSIKAGERSAALEVQIGGPSTPVPRQWGKYISNPQNKVNLCEYLTKSLCKLGQERLPENKKLVIGGGLKEGERCVVVTRGQCCDMPDLKSDQEETDTRLLLHAKYASTPETRIIIHSPDTDQGSKLMVVRLSRTTKITMGQPNCAEWLPLGQPKLVPNKDFFEE